MGDKLRKFKVRGSNESNRTVPRNNVAKGMIEAGTGKKVIMRDRRDRRADEREREWEKDWEES
jgi:hypothetical protein